MLSLEKITRVYKGRKILDGLCLDVKHKEMLVLLGPSGSGKTTILRLIAGFDKPDSGTILIDGKVVSSKKEIALPYKRGIGMVFQDLALWPHMTVEENVGFGLRKDKKEIVKEMLDLVKMDEHLDYYPGRLSGGEKQRVALARALVHKPRILLLDEPLSSLDPVLKDELHELIVKIHDAFDITTIYVTHDQAEAKRMGVRVAVINKGKIGQVGTYENLVSEPSDEFIRRFVRK